MQLIFRKSSRRSGFTLVEVLFAFLVMAIGILSILALFLHGMRGLARSLEANRMAHAAANATATFEYLNLRNDPAVLNALATTASPGPGVAIMIDPVNGGDPTVGGLPRLFNGTLGGNAAFCTLENDINWNEGGEPLQAIGPLESELRYSWAYVLRRPVRTDPLVNDLSLLLYDSRPVVRSTVAPYPTTFDPFAQLVSAGPTRTVYHYTAATFTAGSYEVAITLTSGPGVVPIGLEIGFYNWIMDSSVENGYLYPIKRVEEPVGINQRIFLDRPARRNGTQCCFIRYLANVVEMDEVALQP